MKEWKVLPTDERFINLTEEQKELIWQNYLLDHPELEKKINQADPEFEKEWEGLEKVDTNQDVYNQDDTDISKIMEEFLKERPDMNLPDNYLQEKLRERGIIINNKHEQSDWEEVDD